MFSSNECLLWCCCVVGDLWRYWSGERGECWLEKECSLFVEIAKKFNEALELVIAFEVLNGELYENEVEAREELIPPVPEVIVVDFGPDPW